MEKLFIMSKKELSRYGILEKVVRKEMDQEIAAQALGMSTRQLRRLLKRYREQGPEGLVSGHRKRKVFYSLPKNLKEKVLTLVQEKYSGFSLTLTLEKLQENHGVSISLETLRLWMLKEGLWNLKRRPKPKLHQSRARRSCLGELIQIDGSFHDWFEGQSEKCSLLGFIDDATSSVMYLKFVPRETTQNYLEAFKEYFHVHGLPQSFYSDRHSIFRINNDKEGYREMGVTQLGRALKELYVELICANSPQAKGRVERLFRTLQDRLVKEMSLRGIKNIEKGNAYLKEYIPLHNAKFSHPPIDPQNKHIPLSQEIDLTRILCYKSKRKLTKNLELSYGNQILQIDKKHASHGLIHAQVDLIETLDGQLIIEHQGRPLSYHKLLVKDHQGRVLNRKEVLSQNLKTG
jgi:transposase